MTRLGELAKVFLKLGAIGFGGPAAHIAMMEDETVTRRGWMSRDRFLDLVGATNLIPGPNSTEMAIHVGYIRAGWRGLIVAGTCFIFPAVTITAILAWIYTQWGTLPEVEPFLAGIKPAVLAVIFGALWRLGKKAIKNSTLLVIGIAVVGLLLLGLDNIVALLLGGVLGAIALQIKRKISPPPAAFFLLGMAATGTPTVGAPSLWQLGLFFLKVGAVLFGSGYVLIAFLEGELVNELGWLTQQQLLDAIAIGQFTPGPVLSTSTFIGYLIRGVPGAAVATLGIFLPSFLFVLLLNPLIPKMRQSPWTAAFLDAVNVSAVALMAVVTANLARTTLFPPTGVNWVGIAIALAAGVAVIRWKVNAAWLVLGGAIVGWLVYLLG